MSAITRRIGRNATRHAICQHPSWSPSKLKAALRSRWKGERSDELFLIWAELFAPSSYKQLRAQVEAERNRS